LSASIGDVRHGYGYICLHLVLLCHSRWCCTTLGQGRVLSTWGSPPSPQHGDQRGKTRINFQGCQHHTADTDLHLPVSRDQPLTWSRRCPVRAVMVPLLRVPSKSSPAQPTLTLPGGVIGRWRELLECNTPSHQPGGHPTNGNQQAASRFDSRQDRVFLVQ